MSIRFQRVALGLILLASISLRFIGLDWGIRSLEDFTHEGKALSVNRAGFNADAEALYNAAASLDDSYVPKVEYAGGLHLFNSYGTVFLYLNRAFAYVAGAVQGFEPFGESASDSNQTRMSGRWVSAIASVVLVWVTWLIGHSLLGPKGAVATALVSAFLPMSTQAAHLATVDCLLGLWFGAALWSSLRVLSDARTSDYLLAGLFIGLATATKINGLFLLLPLGLSHLLRQSNRFSVDSFFSAVSSREIYFSTLVALGTWMVLTPAAIFEFWEYFSPKLATPYQIQFSLRKASELASSHRGWLHLEGVSTYFYHPLNVFPPGLGWVVQLLLVGGVILAVVKRSPSVLVVALSFIVYYLLIARLPDKPIRFFVPMAAFISVLTAYPVVHFLNRMSFRVVGIVGICLLVEPVGRSMAVASVYLQKDSRVAAAEWIQIHIPTAGTLMLERGHNSLASLVSRWQVSLLMADLEHEFANARGEQLAEQGHFTAVIEAEFLSQVDYFAFSDERYALKRVRSAAGDFYDRLFAGELGFELAASFPGRPDLFGIEWETDETDLNWSRYDHPSTFVFRRVTDEPSLYVKRPDLSVYRLNTWEDTRELIHRAQKGKVFMFFKRCLPAKYKERAGEHVLVDKFMAFLKDPQTLTGQSDQMTAIREDNGWRIKME